MFLKRLIYAKPIATLGFILLGWLVLPTLFKTLLRISFYEFQAPALLAPSYVRDLQIFWSSRLHSKKELFQAGRDIARLNASYELGLQETELLREEIQRMERILDLPEHTTYKHEIARVVLRDTPAWWQQIIIRKGRKHGIIEGLPVIFLGGVVGKVREVRAYTSVVDLVSSNHFRIAAQFVGDSRPISYQGTANPPFSDPLGEINYIPTDLTLQPGEAFTVVTSGLGGVFPPGLVIGRVNALTTNPDGLFKTSTVLLDKRLSSISEVAVLIPITEDIP